MKPKYKKQENYTKAHYDQMLKTNDLKKNPMIKKKKKFKILTENICII